MEHMIPRTRSAKQSRREKDQVRRAQDIVKGPGLIWRELMTDKQVDRLVNSRPPSLDIKAALAHILKLDRTVQAYQRFVTGRDKLAVLAREMVKEELQDTGLARWDVLMRTFASHSHFIYEYITAHIERLEEVWIITPLTNLMLQHHCPRQPSMSYTRREMVDFAKVFDGQWPAVKQARLSQDLMKIEYLSRLNANVRERLSHATIQILTYRPEVVLSEVLTLCFRLPYNCVVRSARPVDSHKGTLPVFSWPDVDEQRIKLSLAWRQDNL
ncbi:hypothetical protein PV08_08563 [Exophiala spinifera]|uniref:Uncharacterized protein n=1 Tax=Exophiala spinifera TaxID=91928 RepID=A0A0D2B3W6_9EURO|nr:uncharacterized protein PV08_08563 [Exophiala spinifera]KIW13375.1 hypothetical protein PV08_08563 [Exophiala spinifera]